jgi:hypothetical protein
MKMKKLVLSVLLLVGSIVAFSQVYYRETIDDPTASSRYALELEIIRAKYKVPTAFGYTKTVTLNPDGKGMNETIIVFYKSKTGEVEEKVVCMNYIILPKKIKQ